MVFAQRGYYLTEDRWREEQVDEIRIELGTATSHQLFRRLVGPLG